jgi:CubicO group peptidase (beta-lactamase class C family)
MPRPRSGRKAKLVVLIVGSTALAALPVASPVGGEGSPPKCFGKPATIVGDAGDNLTGLDGTKRRRRHRRPRRCRHARRQGRERPHLRWTRRRPGPGGREGKRPDRGGPGLRRDTASGTGDAEGGGGADYYLVGDN